MDNARAIKYARQLLAEEMGDISEEFWAAGWIGGLEYDLWRIVLNGGGDYGMGTVSADRAAELRQLAEDAGGWETGDGFLPMDEWLKKYDACDWIKRPVSADQPE